MIAANDRHTLKRMAVAAASQWAQSGVVGHRSPDFAAVAANRLFVHIQALEDPAAGAPCRRAPANAFRRGHSIRGLRAPLRGSAGRNPGSRKRAAEFSQSEIGRAHV